MGCACSYSLMMVDMPDGYDTEMMLFKIGKIAREATVFFNQYGNPTGNDGPWNSLTEDMTAVSEIFPDTMFYVEETINYDGESQKKYLFSSGRYKEIEPTMIWPEFTEVDWAKK